jgi:flotillin
MEGNLRGVLATLTPEEVNEDRLKFAESLTEEAEHDFRKLGLQIDTLKIQHVTDEVNYLNSIGRKRIAEIIKEAEISESNCMKDANKVSADAEMRAKVARADAERHIVQARNALRKLQAEQELQEVRKNLEALRLEADVVVPADIDRQARELLAAGDAAPIVEDGHAIAEATRMLGEAWAEAGGAARDIYVLANLEKIAAKVAEACRGVRVDEVHLVDDGTGGTIPRYAAAYPNMVAEILRSLSTASGVDVLDAVGGLRATSGEEG